MSERPPQPIFNEEMAVAYDERFARLGAFRDALQLSVRIALADLPAQARILSVGAGTGADVLSLGEQNPEWQFTLVEPAPAMLAVARRRCEEAGLTARCTFHEGYLDSLPEGPPFHAATALLVSQFVTDAEQRRQFFVEIARRLLPGAPLVNGELSCDGPRREQLLQSWMKALEYNGFSQEHRDGWMASYNQHFIVSDTDEIEALLQAAGFNNPCRILQTSLIQAFLSSKQ